MPYAEVVVEITNRRLDRIFHYAIPSALQPKIKLGSKVLVPFGYRKIRGIVVGFVPTPEVEPVKEISELLDEEPVLNEELLKLAQWMAEYYLCPLSLVLQAMIPAVAKSSKKTKEEQAVALCRGLEPNQLLAKLTRAPKQALVVRALMAESPQPVNELLKKTGTTRAVLKALEKKGVVEFRELGEPPPRQVEKPFNLNREQGIALARIREALMAGKFHTQLLYGVTGSGKTEVYLHALEINRSLGKEAIVLLPEITLTEQMVSRYRARFGQQVVVWHSNLSVQERREAWEKILNRQASIIVGARSAIFAPFTKLGLIIVDEEHETTYRQESNPKYDAREVALKRGELNQALVLFGSATPSLESAFKASCGRYELLTLKERYEARPLPQVEIVDLRQELREGNFSIFSRLLQAKLQEKLSKGEQSILFINRRGFNSFFVCRDCGHTIKCKYCAISLTHHESSQDLRCHYCGYRQDIPQICPQCGSKRIRGFGIGTEKVVQEVKKIFPQARVARLDTDVSKKKGYRQDLLENFRQGKIDILVGTQMIAKGLDFPGVTLVGVVSADLSLNLPDFRARERTFQLLTQVAGRAGRGKIPGQVIIQTYSPDNQVILAAQKHDFEEFYRQEIILRKELNYPPFVHLVRVLVMGGDEAKVVKGCQDFGEIIKGKIKDYPHILVLGPAPAAILKLQNLYRWQVILKGSELSVMREVVAESLREYHRHDYLAGQLRWSIDIDPVGI